MALYAATQSGYFNNPAIWGGNTPNIGDCVNANGKCVRINQNVNLGTTGGFCNSICNSTGSSDWGFVINGSTLSLTGNIFPSVSRVLTLSSNSNITLCGNLNNGDSGDSTPYNTEYGLGVFKSTATIYGNAYSTYSGYCRNIYPTILQNNSNLTINGYLYGNTIPQQYNVTNATLFSSNTSQSIINGNVLITSGLYNVYGCYYFNNLCVDSTSTANVNGNVLNGGISNSGYIKVNGKVYGTDGGVGICNLSNATMCITDNVCASVNKPAIISNGPCYVQKLLLGPKGQFPIQGSFTLSNIPNAKININNSNNQIISYNTSNTSAALPNKRLLSTIIGYDSASKTVCFSNNHGLLPNSTLDAIPNTFSFCYTNNSSLPNNYNLASGTYCYSYTVFNCHSNCCWVVTENYSQNSFLSASKVNSIIDSRCITLQNDVFPSIISPQTVSDAWSYYDGGLCRCYCLYPSQICNIVNTSFSCPMGPDDYIISDSIPQPVPTTPNVVGGIYKYKKYNNCYCNYPIPYSTISPLITSVTTNSNYTNLKFSTPHGLNTYGLISLSTLDNSNLNMYNNTYILSTIPDLYSLNLYNSSLNNFSNLTGIGIVNSIQNISNLYYYNNILLFNATYPYYSNITSGQSASFVGFIEPTTILNDKKSGPIILINPNTLLIPINLNSYNISLTGSIFIDKGLTTFIDQNIALASVYPDTSSVRLGYQYANNSFIGTMAVPPTSSVRGNVIYDSTSLPITGNYFFPKISDVRLNTNFDILSTGNLSLPPVSSVLYGVQVDDTTGTAVLNVSSVWNAFPQIFNSNTIGDKILKSTSKSDLFGLL
jgi:hypothetical protein